MNTTLEHDIQQCKQANASGRTPVVFIHGYAMGGSLWRPRPGRERFR